MTEYTKCHLNDFRVKTTDKGYQFCFWCGEELCRSEIIDRACYSCVIAGKMRIAKAFRMKS